MCILLSTALKFVAKVTHHTDALLEYKVHNLSLTSDSRQELQLRPHSIPSLHVEPRHSYQFHLPAHYIILWVWFIWFIPYLTCPRHLQLLENDKLLLIVDDRSGGILVYLDSQQSINTAVHRPPRKSLHRSKIGETCIFTFDEARRTLAICEAMKVASLSPKFLEMIDPSPFSASTTHLHLWWAIQPAPELGKWNWIGILVFFWDVNHCHVFCTWKWRTASHWEWLSGKDIFSVDTTIQV